MKAKKPVIEEEQKKDITLIPLADTHTGSSTALHPNEKLIDGEWKSLTEMMGWRYMHNHHYYPNSKQVRMWEHFKKCLEVGFQARVNRKLILMVVGDANDGDHHGTFELVTRNIGEQKDTHIQIMLYAMEKLNYQRGDELMYLSGTSVHVGDEENGIAKELGAYQYADGFYSASFVEMDINGALVWAYHKGAAAGMGHNKGNSAVNYLKRIYYQCLQEGKRVPDLVMSGHTHDPFHATWTNPENKTMHYVILPSWQDKTRFVKDNMPLSINRVGMQIIQISADGVITIPKPMILESPLGEVIKI